VFTDVFREDLVDQRLVADAPTPRLLAERIQDAWINPDRNQLARFVRKRRPTHTPH
jgi:hypothetical protein